MSFSFNVRAASNADAEAAVEAKMAEIVAQQDVHSHDQATVIATVGSYLDLLADDGAVSVSVSGSVGWAGDGEDRKFIAASISVLVQRCE